jgi:hypothetical protein
VQGIRQLERLEVCLQSLRKPPSAFIQTKRRRMYESKDVGDKR